VETKEERTGANVGESGFIYGGKKKKKGLVAGKEKKGYTKGGKSKVTANGQSFKSKHASAERTSAREGLSGQAPYYVVFSNVRVF